MKFSPLLLVQYDCSALEPAQRAEAEEQLRGLVELVFGHVTVRFEELPGYLTRTQVRMLGRWDDPRMTVFDSLAALLSEWEVLARRSDHAAS
ncbi:hypothetical protein [Deinococcus peraridilitoris]|uniref:Uncharacterized protein n=1 Tax=Deinococcus peraridilitoris (strain DSM 19664 / LMG 22246 / CIP 109416 / KR-200) TaxID=937777 RepID=L0A0P6_DEIPD|nr:hypothetical protein [Deinococcus peraridilitoris]AFZ67029.1 hypothetical protein Deipe_1488 [Deinococcus peraridilitoris DSM 19664]